MALRRGAPADLVHAEVFLARAIGWRKCVTKCWTA